MTHFDIVVAYKKIEDLSDIKDYHAKEQWAIYKLRQKLKPSVTFFEEQSKKISDKYREFADNEGIISGEPYKKYATEIEELRKTEADIDIEKITLPFVDGITFIIAEELENFIEFTE